MHKSNKVRKKNFQAGDTKTSTGGGVAARRGARLSVILRDCVVHFTLGRALVSAEMSAQCAAQALLKHVSISDVQYEL